MGEVVSIPGTWEMRLGMSQQDRATLDRLQQCRECKVPAAWGDFDKGVGYCEEHNPWTDRALGSRVREKTEPDLFRRWLDSLPKNRVLPRRDGTCGPLREYLYEVIGTDLLVYPPVVQLADGSFGPVVHLSSWTKRFDDMLMWVEGETGSKREECLRVLAKAVELDEVASNHPLGEIEAKGRESEALPPEVQAALLKAAEEVRPQRRSWWSRMLGR